uniref:Uncharacterized protein n=1 Tax=viral metagenome TaxID=1070528 RepID=A0A6M3IXA3_9ZZZZ
MILANFIDKILSLGKIQIHTIGELEYSKEALYRIKSPDQTNPKPRIFQTLMGLVEYISEIQDSEEPEDLFIIVQSPVEVNLLGPMDPDNDNIQFHYAQATLPVKNFAFNTWHSLEDFILQLMSMFHDTDDRQNILAVLSSLANKHIVENNDDQFSQSLQIKTGLTTKAMVEVKNPVLLKPFRTFREVAQPKSNFILRYQNRNDSISAALFEADGGAWQLAAIQNIKAWLVANTKISVIG